MNPNARDRQKLWRDLLIARSLVTDQRSPDSMAFHALFLHLREMESTDPIAHVMHDVLESKPFKNANSIDFKNYLVETWERQGRPS